MTAKRTAGLGGGLDTLIPDTNVDPEPHAPASEPATPARTGRGKETPAKGQIGGKEKLSGYVPVELLEACRDVVYRIPGMGMGDFLQEAAIREIRRLEKLHNNGETFPPRPNGQRLAPGPRVR